MKTLCVIVAMIMICSVVTPLAEADEQGAQKLLKEGLLGAAVGGIAAGASDGDAGKGALIGAGTNIAGQAIMGALSSPSSQTATTTQSQQIQADAATVYQQGYNEGYQDGFEAGYEKGYTSGTAAR